MIELPHWARGDCTPENFSQRFRQLGLSRTVRISRSLPAKRRCRADDPTSFATGVSNAERRSGTDRMLRVVGEGAADAVRRLARSGFVEELTPVRALAYARAPDGDPAGRLNGQPGQWALDAVGAAEAFAVSAGHSSIRVAILDTGLDRQHPEFRGKVVGGYDFVALEALGNPDGSLRGDIHGRDPDWSDDTGHGTHVAGTLCALGLEMPPGVAGRCQMLIYRVLGTAMEAGRAVGTGTPEGINNGMKAAIDAGAHVINLSLGLGAFGPVVPHARMVRYARMHNVVVVAAAGNLGRSDPIYPGAVPGVVTVGAVDNFGRATDFSSYGPHVDLAAPGTDIYSAELGGSYGYRDGTSHAAPLVAGCAALMIAHGHTRGATFRESTIRRLLRDSARSPRNPNPRLGAGILNMGRALRAASELITAHGAPSGSLDEAHHHRKLAAVSGEI